MPATVQNKPGGRRADNGGSGITGGLLDNVGAPSFGVAAPLRILQTENAC